MTEIKEVLICGIGAIGSIYANKINNFSPDNLKILVDKVRFEKYQKTPNIFNGKELKLKYILPDEKGFKADLIIIATKFDGLNSAIGNIKNFVGENTIIMSLLNGVISEEIISREYGWKHTLLSYYIGHSTMRSGNVITHDGIGKIVFGIDKSKHTDLTDIEKVKAYFDMIGIDYEIPDDMLYSYWLKFMLNISSNQPSAILKMTFGQMQNNPKFIEFMKKIMSEVQQIATVIGVNNTKVMTEEALEAFNKMSSEGKTSMLQDVEAGRKTEVEIFAGTIIELGKKYNIPTPYNCVLKDMIDVITYEF